MGDSVSLVRAVRDQTPILVSSNIRARVLASSFPGENMLQSSSHKKRKLLSHCLFHIETAS